MPPGVAADGGGLAAVGLPEAAADDLDHLYVVGLKTRVNGANLREGGGILLGCG